MKVIKLLFPSPDMQLPVPLPMPLLAVLASLEVAEPPKNGPYLLANAQEIVPSLLLLSMAVENTPQVPMAPLVNPVLAASIASAVPLVVPVAVIAAVVNLNMAVTVVVVVKISPTSDPTIAFLLKRKLPSPGRHGPLTQLLCGTGILSLHMVGV